MSLSAFHGQAEVRTLALRKLAAQIEAGRLGQGSFHWSDKSGSVAACLIESGDPQQWAGQLGLPRWLAYALDAVTGGLAPALALAKTTALLNAVVLGSDADAQGSGLVCGLLDEAWTGLAAEVRTPELEQTLNEVRALHARAHQGNPLAGAEWRQVRKQAMAITDALQIPQQQAVAKCIESAGWDPRSSHTSVADVLRQWMQLESLKADAEFGWTDVDDKNIRSLLGQMNDQYKVGKPEETRDVFLLLEEHHPETSVRLRAYLKFGRDHHAVCAERAANLLIRLLESVA